MAKSSKKHPVLATFTVPTKVEIRRPEFERLTSLDALDVGRLGKGSHKLEIGFIRGGPCRHLVRAVIRNGMVNGFEIEPCEDSGQAPPPELLAVVKKARAQIGAAAGKWQPIPVDQLLRSSARQLELIIIIGGGCFFICIWGHCLMCCWSPPRCYVPDIIRGPL